MREKVSALARCFIMVRSTAQLTKRFRSLTTRA
jgi:hypothetical protein